MWRAHAWSLDSLQVTQSLKIMLEWITFAHDFRGSRDLLRNFEGPEATLGHTF